MKESIRLQIESEVDTRVGTAIPGIAIEWENVEFDREGKSEWLRVNILDGETINASLGRTKKVFSPGLLVIGIFVKKGTGTKRMREIADLIGDEFRNLRLSSGTVYIDFYQPTLDNTDAGDSNFHLRNLTLPFRGEDVKTDAS